MHADALVFRCRVFSFIFIFRTNDKKGHLDENNFRHYYSHFFASAILNFDHNYMLKVPSQQLRDTDNRILKDTLELKIPSMLRQLQQDHCLKK